MVKSAKKAFYKLYKKVDKIPLIVTAVYFLHCVVMPFLTGKYKPAKYKVNINSRLKKYDNANPLLTKDVKIALICDEMTYENIKDVCKVYFVTPDNWVNVFEKYKPDVFLCESAWSGIEQYKDSWRGKIYSNKAVLFETRKTLFNILNYCNKVGIKTVFWNKEDPVYFDDKYHNFVNTALKFDYIFTTAEECVKRYVELGGRNVGLLKFGFSPVLFNSSPNEIKENKAVFAGSYYADHPQRCKDMEKIFDMVISNNIKLEIYDRHFNSTNPINKFPDKYNKYIHEAVDYTKLGDILKTSRYAININTEKKSETMFARRVYELMACRCIIISNHSEGMKKIFGNKVWFFGEEFDFDREKEFVESNYNYVMSNCTNKKIVKNMLKSIGILIVM